MANNESIERGFERLWTYMITKLKNEYIPLTGGTLIGDLSAKKITGTVLQTTEASEKTHAKKICILEDDNCIHWISAENLVGDGVVLEGEYATKDYVDSLMIVDTSMEV